MIQNFVWRGKRPGIAKTILKEKNEVRVQIIFKFKTYYKVIEIKTM